MAGLTQDQIARHLGKTKAWVSGVLRILDLPEAVRQKAGYTQRPLSVDALTRIARLEDPNLQSRLVDGVLAGSSQSEIREQIRQAHRGNKSRSATKTNRTFHTRFGALVTVRSTRGRLTDEQTVAALQEALDEATTDSRVLGKRPE